MRVNAFHRMGGHLPRQAKTTIVVPACPITQDKNRLFPPKRAIRILTYTACLSVTVDNYSHTSEHLFEFVQRHAGEYRSSTQPMKSTAQRHSIEPTTQRAAAARYGHGPNAWNQESPSDRRARSILPRVQSLKNGHIRQLRHTLIPGQRPAIATTEHFFKQLPKFPFTHTRQCATTRRTEKPAPPNGDAGQTSQGVHPSHD